MSISPAKFIDADPLFLAGLDGFFTFQDIPKIPGQWQRFGRIIAIMPRKGGPITYGLCHDMTQEGFGYMCGVEVEGAAELPEGMTETSLPAQRYAVFEHPGPTTTLSTSIDAIWHEWLPQSGEELPETPLMFERYGEAFDPQTLSGDIELWIAVKSQSPVQKTVGHGPVSASNAQ